MPLMLQRIARGEIDPSFVITHGIGIEEASARYRTFRDKHDSCIKVVIKTWRSGLFAMTQTAFRTSPTCPGIRITGSPVAIAAMA